VATIDGSDYRIACGHGQWRKGRAAFAEFAAEPVAATGAWTSEDTYVAKLCFYETPYYVLLRLHFEGNKLLLDTEYNVSFEERVKPQLIGQAE
jgi:hypothetical protein